VIASPGDVAEDLLARFVRPVLLSDDPMHREKLWYGLSSGSAAAPASSPTAVARGAVVARDRQKRAGRVPLRARMAVAVAVPCRVDPIVFMGISRKGRCSGNRSAVTESG